MELLSKVVDGIFYALHIQKTDTTLRFTCTPATYAVVQCTVDGKWNTHVIQLDAEPVDLPADTFTGIYHINYGLSQKLADIYAEVSPRQPLSKPNYRTHGNIIACKALDYYRMYNTGTTPSYVFNQDVIDHPETLPPQGLSSIYRHDSEVYLRDNANFQQLTLRELTDKELQALIPTDVTKNIFRFNRTGRLNWMPAKEYTWTGTLTYVDTSGIEAIFVDDANNIFHYNFEHLKLLLKYLVHGKISGQFIFKYVTAGQFIKYLPVPVTSNHLPTVSAADDLCLCETD